MAFPSKYKCFPIFYFSFTASETIFGLLFFSAMYLEAISVLISVWTLKSSRAALSVERLPSSSGV